MDIRAGVRYNGDFMENLTRLLLDRHLAEGRGEAIAIREPKRAWSYARLADEVKRAGAVFASRGVRAGDRVAIAMHDSLEAAAAFLGAARIGALPVPLSTLLRAGDLRGILGDARPKVAVVHRDLAVLLEQVGEELPAPPELLVAASGTTSATSPGEHPDFMMMLARSEPIAPCVDGDGPAMLLYSGGSGAARGVPHGTAHVLASLEGWAHRVTGLSASDRVFSSAKLYTAYGLGAGLLFPLAAGAQSMLLPERARPRAVFTAMAQFKPTVFCAVPSLYGQMLHDFAELTAPRPTCFESVRAAVSGAEPLPEGLWRKIKETFRVEVLHGFGSTEALHFFLSSRPGEIRPGASGKPLDGYEARVVDEAGAPVKGMEIGQLEVRGPSVATGYFGRGEDPAVFRPGGWLHTGDRFFVDGDGWYYHCGRVDDQFKVSGKWVAPTEVENALLLHPAVWECAVVGLEDPEGLTIPVAYVVANVGHEPTHELGHELMEFVKREIAPYKYPRRVEFVAELPKNAQGKVQRWRLRPGPTG
jgi:benzoate-CoA ligase family protein